jgi:hypothetical protein
MHAVLRDGIFLLIFELIVSHKSDLEGVTKLFVHSLPFYTGEQVFIDDDLMKSTMNYLSFKPDTNQCL